MSQTAKYKGRIPVKIRLDGDFCLLLEPGKSVVLPEGNEELDFWVSYLKEAKQLKG